MSWGREASPRALMIELIVALVAAIFAVLFFLDVSTDLKLLLVVVLVIVAFLNFVALVGLLERWKREWSSYKSAQSIRRHPDLVTELYRLHDRIKAVLYDRVAEKPSLALNVPDIMPEGTEWKAKFEMAQRHFTWITRRINDHRTGGKRWTSPEFANTMREIGDHLLMINSVLETIYRSHALDKAESYREKMISAWEAFREEYASAIQQWQAYTERFDETIGYGTKLTIPLPRHLP